MTEDRKSKVAMVIALLVMGGCLIFLYSLP